MKIEIKKPTEEELKDLGVENWGIWEEEVSEFPWEYDEEGKLLYPGGRGRGNYRRRRESRIWQR